MLVGELISMSALGPTALSGGETICELVLGSPLSVRGLVVSKPGPKGKPWMPGPGEVEVGQISSSTRRR